HFPEDFPFESSVFIYNSEDFWAPKYQGENIQKKYLSANFIFLEGSLHDFCVREEGNQTISLEIIKLLSN
ncbi:MAG: hypothetical protein KDK36_13925, partial [Leptospiraceae bacterium]|nr:hypothetical protein [Leptospiraceae bacterium]